MADKSTFESEKYLQNEQRRIYRALWVIDAWGRESMNDGVTLEKVDVQFPNRTGGDYRAILKGRDRTGGRWVAFLGGGTIAELMANIANEGTTRGFLWREDKPWPGNVAGAADSPKK
jgi:hypothetical protein